MIAKIWSLDVILIVYTSQPFTIHFVEAHIYRPYIESIYIEDTTIQVYTVNCIP